LTTASTELQNTADRKNVHSDPWLGELVRTAASRPNDRIDDITAILQSIASSTEPV
jgi:hypothetical protein